MPFALHPTLARDTVEVARLPLCRVRLMNDRRFPWLILVPDRDSLREIHDLPPAGRAALIEEIAQASEVLARLFHPDKLNVGALGNLVPQLHVHVVARTTTDPAIRHHLPRAPRLSLAQGTSSVPRQGDRKRLSPAAVSRQPCRSWRDSLHASALASRTARR